MQYHIIVVCILAMQNIAMGQISLPYSDQHGAIGALSQTENLSKQSSSINQDSASFKTSQSSSLSITNYLVGNLSESFSFEVAPSSSTVRHLGFNGFSLYIKDIGSPNDSRFKYDEHNDRLTILSLDDTTVGSYIAVDSNWTTFTNVITAINVSSFEIRNTHVGEEDHSSSYVSCSVSILRSMYTLPKTTSLSNNPTIKTTGVEVLPQLDLIISTDTLMSTAFSRKVYNDTINERDVKRVVTLQRRLTRADHNETVQCQINSNDKLKTYLMKTARIDIEYGPNLETGALPKVHLENEALKPIEMDCQIEANPSPSYIWYEISRNVSSSGFATDNSQQSSYQQLRLTDENVFGTTKQIARTYESAGKYTMLCQAQSRGKIVQQEFWITINPQSNSMKSNLSENNDQQKLHRFLKILGIITISVLLLCVFTIMITKMIMLKRRKSDPSKDNKEISEKLSNEKQEKSRWGALAIDYSKYKHESLKTDSTSTSHLVESAETNSIQGAPVRSRPSPIISTNSSYRQTPLTSVSLSYRQASALPGFRASASTRCYSPEGDETDEIVSNSHGIALAMNRSRTTTPFGSRKSLSESVQSLRSSQQPAVSLPTKKRVNDLPPVLPKREKTPSPNVFQAKQDYQHHHYHNPAQLRAQQQIKSDDASSGEEPEFEQQQTNQTSEVSIITGSTAASLDYNQVDFHSEYERQIISSPASKQTSIHQTAGTHRDEAPPPYHQIINTSSASQVYMYQEPTEV